MDIKVPANFIPRWYQLTLFQALDGIQGKPESKLKRAFLRWHRRAGKDLACFAYMVKEMFSTKGVYYYVYPNYQQGRKAFWENTTNDGFRFLDLIPGWDRPGKPGSLVKKINNQEMMLETINGSIFRVVGSDNFDTLRGTNPRGIVMSEFAEQHPDAWGVLEPILIGNGGWVIFNSTPKGRNHMYNLEMAIKNHPKWFVSELQTLWPDKPNYSGVMSKEELDDRRMTLAAEGKDPIEMDQEYGVAYAAGVQGAYYADLLHDASEANRVGDFAYDSNYKVHTFWDIGLSDDTAIWFGQYVGNKIVFIDYLEDKGKGTKFYAQALAEKGYEYGTHYLPHDGANRNKTDLMSYENILQAYCLNEQISDDVRTVEKPTNKQHTIDLVRSRFSRYYFDRINCTDGITKLELYHRKWDARAQSFMQAPCKDWTSHAADALTTEALASPASDVFQAQDIDEAPTVISDFNPLGDY